MGAYFVRRNSKDNLYRRVLERYVAMATAAGVTQAVFPEGGLSRDGALRAPKLGLLDYMLKSFDPAGERDLVFIPVGINYDRTLEDRSFLQELDPAARKPGAGARSAGAVRFLFHNLSLIARSRWHRFGYACVNFGSPISTRRYLEAHGLDFSQMSHDERFARVGEFAAEAMTAVGKLIPVLPVSLVSAVLLRDPGRKMSELELKAEVLDMVRSLELAGARVYVPRGDQDYAIDVGLRMLTLRHLVDEEDGVFSPRASEIPLLTYYARSIGHLVK
jgi:glycerol-3-phosphate O-acyltransferase